MSTHMVSAEVLKQDGTVTGSQRVVSNEDGVKTTTPAYHRQGDNILHDKIQLGSFFDVNSVDNYIWFCNEGRWQVDFVVADQVAAGGSGATIDVRVCTATTAPASGTTQLTAAIDLATAGNNGKSVRGTLITTPTIIGPGDRLSIDMSGTLTSLVGRITVGVKRVG